MHCSCTEHALSMHSVVARAWKSSAQRFPNPSTKMVAQLKMIPLGSGSSAFGSLICSPNIGLSPLGYAAERPGAFGM